MRRARLLWHGDSGIMSRRAETCLVKRREKKGGNINKREKKRGGNSCSPSFSIKMIPKSGALGQREGQNGAQRGESSTRTVQGTMVRSIRSFLLVVGEQQEACGAAGSGLTRTVANSPLHR